MNTKKNLTSKEYKNLPIAKLYCMTARKPHRLVRYTSKDIQKLYDKLKELNTIEFRLDEMTQVKCHNSLYPDYKQEYPCLSSYGKYLPLDVERIAIMKEKITREDMLKVIRLKSHLKMTIAPLPRKSNKELHRMLFLNVSDLEVFNILNLADHGRF